MEERSAGKGNALREKSSLDPWSPSHRKQAIISLSREQRDFYTG